MFDAVREPVLAYETYEKAKIEAFCCKLCTDGDRFLCLSHCSDSVALEQFFLDTDGPGCGAVAVVPEAVDSYDIRCLRHSQLAVVQKDVEWVHKILSEVRKKCC